MKTIIKSNISIKEVDNMGDRIELFFYSFTRLILFFTISFLLLMLTLVLNLSSITDLLINVCFVITLSCIFALAHCAFVVIKVVLHIQNDLYKRFGKDILKNLKDCVANKSSSSNCCLKIILNNGDIIIYEFDD